MVKDLKENISIALGLYNIPIQPPSRALNPSKEWTRVEDVILLPELEQS